MASVFTLEAVFAKKGDALLLHFGPWSAPKRVLIDGGPRGVYSRYLEPRLAQLREELGFEDHDPLPFRMVMVSHVDDDHVAGIIDLFSDMESADELQQPQPYAIQTLWHNAFDDILGNQMPAITARMATTASSGDGGGLALPRMSDESRAVVASTGQGRELSRLARKLRVAVNTPFTGLVTTPSRAQHLGHGMWFTVVCPDAERIADYQKKWDKDLQAILAKEQDSAHATAYLDDSPFNLASVSVLVRMRGRSMLLTGDARGDHLIEGLERKRILRKTKPLHVDILKLPHHGSDRNVEQRFFERITADHYVASGDGSHSNPDVTTLDMIARARTGHEYTVHFTFRADAHVKEKNAKRKAALTAIHEWVQNKPVGCRVAHRAAHADTYSITIDLLDSLDGS